MALTPPRSIAELDDAIPEHLPYRAAFIIDGVVQQVFHLTERGAAVVLSNPIIVQCETAQNGGPENGWLYHSETGEFTSRA